MAWSNYLSRGMATGAIPEAEPQLLTRAVLGLYNSVWHWYRPRGTLSLADVEAFFVPRMLAIVGFEPVPAAASPLGTSPPVPLDRRARYAASQVPVQTGSRFSRKAATPSFASLELWQTLQAICSITISDS